MARVLVIEDDETINRLVAFALRQDGLLVETVTDGGAALDAFDRSRPDVVVLDLLLPNVDGFEICRRIRAATDTPILILTGLDQEDDVVRGLRLGADDYLTKPFSVRVFLARVEALLRRVGRQPPGKERTIEIGDLVVDLQRIEVRRAGRVAELTPAEFRLIACLARNAGQVVNSGTLLRQIQDGVFDDREAQEIVKVHIRHLRNKIEPDPETPRYIRTVRGFGYMLELQLAPDFTKP